MATSGGLTEEQKSRMEVNRKRALLLRAQRSQSNNQSCKAATNQVFGQNTSSINANATQVYPRTANPKPDFAATTQRTSFTMVRPSLNCIAEETSSTSDHSVKNSIPSELVSCSGKDSGHANKQTHSAEPSVSTSHSDKPTRLKSNLTAKGSYNGNNRQPSMCQNACIISKPKTIMSFYSAKPRVTTDGQQSKAGTLTSRSEIRKGSTTRLESDTQKSTSGAQARATLDARQQDFSSLGSGAKSSFGGSNGNNSQGICALMSRNRFSVNVGYNAKLIEIFKEIPSKNYDAVNKKWSFALSDYDTLMEAVKPLRPSVEIEPLPKPVCAAFRKQRHGQEGERIIPDANLKSVDEELVNTLMNFQGEGVNFAISRKGRVLIADDMGLGKTLQAICIACYYRTEWPVLVVSPSSVRHAWAEAFQKWIPSLDPQNINVVVNSKSSATSGQVNILSYDLMHRKAQELKQFRFQVIIMDECHFLKNVKTARTKAALPLLKSAPRVILLSGTPALSRPSELYTQITGVAPWLFPSFHEFGLRYCNATQNPWGWDYSGSSNMAELQLLLEECIMIRRLKQDVLKELPSKSRQMVLMDPSVVKTNSKALKFAAGEMAKKKPKSEERGILLKYFAETGIVKTPAIRDYVLDLLEAGHKFLVFAHHQTVLDALCAAVSQKKHDYIRIDGSNTALQRKASCDKFQQEEACRVAILSITAANAGITLTSASMVVFAELFWNPGILVQAEDRVHRIGQQDSTTIRYLIAKGTADDYIWPLVQKKLSVLEKAGLSKDDFSAADTTVFKDPKQKSILSFFEKSFLEGSDESEQEDLACLMALESQHSSEEGETSATTHSEYKTDAGIASGRQSSLIRDSNRIGHEIKGRTRTKGSSNKKHQGNARNLFSNPWPVKKLLSESNDESSEESTGEPPSKRQKSMNS